MLEKKYKYKEKQEEKIKRKNRKAFINKREKEKKRIIKRKKQKKRKRERKKENTPIPAAATSRFPGLQRQKKILSLKRYIKFPTRCSLKASLGHR
jgi:hypothetical protein